jgi:hypothetical protein
MGYAESVWERAMTPEAAIGLLQHEAGKGLDPTLVERFIEILPALNAQLDAPGRSSRFKCPADERPFHLTTEFSDIDLQRAAVGVLWIADHGSASSPSPFDKPT